MTPLPFISVVVPTFNRAHILPALVAALEAQDYPRELFEVLIVDDGSRDGTVDYISRLNGRHFRTFLQSHGGASRARNLGAANARGELLAFTDDDCAPEPDWLRTIGESWTQRGGNCALLGHTYSEHRSNTFLHSVLKESEPVVTCNFAAPREVFEKVGGFDPHFILYFEDEDLGLRIRKAGVPIVYEPRMRVLHPSKYQTFHGFLKLRSGLQYFCYMSQKHPDCDHWIRHRTVIRQIQKKFVFVGLPFAALWFWPPAALLLALVLASYVTRDTGLALRYRRELRVIGFRLRKRDMAAFALLNWSVPFIDAARIAKGYIRDYGELRRQKRSERLAHSVRTLFRRFAHR